MSYVNSRAKLKVGDKVRVKDGLIVGKRYYSETSTVGNIFSANMEQNIGKVAEIIGIKQCQYILSLDKYNLYTYEMLHDLAVEDDPDFVKSDYIFNKEVEALIDSLMEEQVQNALDRALDERLFEKDLGEFNKILSLLNK